MLVDKLIREDPNRLAQLGSLVQSLEFITISGICVHASDASAGYVRPDQYISRPTSEGDRNIYDIISKFSNLTRLALFVQHWWGPETLGQSAKALETGLANLRDVEIGGQIPRAIVLALLARPQQIERLALINLIEKPEADCGPLYVACLGPISARFSRLTHLHLSKLADFEEGDYGS